MNTVKKVRSGAGLTFVISEIFSTMDFLAFIAERCSSTEVFTKSGSTRSQSVTKPHERASRHASRH